MEKNALYGLIVALLSLSAYLHSPVVALGSVVLCGITAGEAILSQKKKDAEIVALLARMEKIEKDHKALSMDITNVSERAKTILGEVY